MLGAELLEEEGQKLCIAAASDGVPQRVASGKQRRAQQLRLGANCGQHGCMVAGIQEMRQIVGVCGAEQAVWAAARAEY